MKLTWVRRELLPRRAFRISRSGGKTKHNVFVRLEHQGIAGYGETAPNSFYSETWEGVTDRLEAARPFLAHCRPRSVADLASIWEEIWSVAAPSRAAQCALDIALWDWLARREGVSVCELAWGFRPKEISTFCTIGLSTAEELQEKLEELRGVAQIKIKSDKDADLGVIDAVRASCSALLAVDANCAWAPARLAALRQDLRARSVAFLEQPLPPTQDAALPDLPGGLPLLADESCVTEQDLERLPKAFAGFNIKLVKCGGLTPALRMARRGRELGKLTMVGCMLESSALIAAGAVVAQRTDYADLDGAWLIGDDPFTGWRFAHGNLLPPCGDGLGAHPVPDLFATPVGV